MMQSSLFRQTTWKIPLLQNSLLVKHYNVSDYTEKNCHQSYLAQFCKLLNFYKKANSALCSTRSSFKKSYQSINRVTISYESWFKIHPWHYVQHFYFPNFKLEVFRIFVVPDLLLQIWVFLCSPILSTRVSVSSFFPIQFINTLEAAIQGCSQGKLFCKYAANLQENTHAEG